jgi:hypothetical protein
MNDLLKYKKYNIILYINNRIDQFNVTSSCLVSELRQIIIDKYILNPLNYSIFYKNKKLSINDFSRVSDLFNDDQKPFIFIVQNKELFSEENTKRSSLINISSNLNEKKMSELLNKFFEYKRLPYNAILKNPLRGKYKIKFNKPLLAKEFIQYFNLIKYKKNPTNSDSYTLNNKNEIKLPKIHKLQYRSISSYGIMEKNKKENLINKIIQINTRDTFITEKSVSSGLNIYHDSVRNTKKRKYDKNDYKGISYLPFMNPDEKYYREKYLDKKNWLNKKGFIVSVGNYKMGGNNFISNYVAATPSQFPLCHNFRDVNKNKWIDKKGFSL